MGYTNNSTKHSMRMTASGAGKLLEDDDVHGVRSSSACTATMTADTSYIDFGHSLIVRIRNYATDQC
jgi:hypothetical protein